MSLHENSQYVNGDANNFSTGGEIGHNGGPVIDDDARYADPKGAIMVGRSIRDHYLVGFGSLGKYAKSEAWLDLIMECRYKSGTVMNAGRAMEIKPGQLVGAVSWLAARWNWSPREVRTFLDKLQDEGMIERFSPGAEPVDKTDLCTNQNQGPTKSAKQKGKQAQVLTISKYSLYQFIKDASRQAKRQASDKQATSNRHASDMNLIRKEGKKEKEKDMAAVAANQFVLVATSEEPKRITPTDAQLTEAFEIFWTTFPKGRKQAKGDALDLFKSIVLGKHKTRRATANEIIQGAKRYASTKPDPDFVPMPSTWLNQGRWGDLEDQQSMKRPDQKPAYSTPAEDPETLKWLEENGCMPS